MIETLFEHLIAPIIVGAVFYLLSRCGTDKEDDN